MPDNDQADAAGSSELLPEHGASASTDQTPRSSFPPIRTLPMLRPLHWIALGWRDLRATGGRSLFYGLFFAAMGLLLSVVLAHAPAYLSALTCGFLLLGPFLALGLYDLSRRLEQRQSGLLPTLFSMQGRWSNIGVLALVLAVVMMVWARASLIVFALFYNRGMPSIEGFLQQLLSIDNLRFIVVYVVRRRLVRQPGVCDQLGFDPADAGPRYRCSHRHHHQHRRLAEKYSGGTGMGPADYRLYRDRLCHLVCRPDRDDAADRPCDLACVPGCCRTGSRKRVRPFDFAQTYCIKSARPTGLLVWRALCNK